MIFFEKVDFSDKEISDGAKLFWEDEFFNITELHNLDMDMDDIIYIIYCYGKDYLKDATVEISEVYLSYRFEEKLESYQTNSDYFICFTYYITSANKESYSNFNVMFRGRMYDEPPYSNFHIMYKEREHEPYNTYTEINEKWHMFYYGESKKTLFSSGDETYARLDYLG